MVRLPASAGSVLLGSPETGVQLPAASGSLVHSVEGVATIRADAGAVLGPELQAVAAETPELISFQLSAHNANIYFLFSVWTPNGKIRYWINALGPTADGYSNWSAEGTTHAALYWTGATPGETYEVYYQIDCIPDVPGWDEGALTKCAGLQWVQPSPVEPPHIENWPG